MRLRSFIFPVCSTLFLLACQGESGSTFPNVNLEGRWGGTLTANGGGAPESFFVNFVSVGEESEGSFATGISGSTTLVPVPSALAAACPERAFEWSSTLRGSKLTGTMFGLGRRDEIRIEMELTDDDTGVGRYEFTKSPELQPDAVLPTSKTRGDPLQSGCEGRAGIIEFVRLDS